MPDLIAGVIQERHQSIDHRFLHRFDRRQRLNRPQLERDAFAFGSGNQRPGCLFPELPQHTASVPASGTDQWDAPFTSREEVERFYVHLEETLVDIEFLNPAAPRQLMTRLRRLFNRVRLDEMELNILRGMLTQTQKWVARAKRED